MSTESNSRKEHPSTYFVQDRDNKEELARLKLQDRMLTDSMGGVLPEQPNPAAFHHVLDVGCGTGDWLIEVARTYPEISLLVGVDISRTMVEYARAQAQEQGVADRVEFRVMDTLRMLEFPSNFFDLVNQRLGVSYLRTWDWANLLQKFQHVTKAGGIIRVTESDITHGNSPALSKLVELFLETLYNAGNFATPQIDATLSMLPALLHQQGIQQVKTQHYTLTYPAGTPQGDLFAQDMKHAFRTLLPFFRKWTRVPENYEKIYQQALVEMRQPNFVGAWNVLTVWGTCPQRKDRLSSVERH